MFNKVKLVLVGVTLTVVFALVVEVVLLFGAVVVFVVVVVAKIRYFSYNNRAGLPLSDG